MKHLSTFNENLMNITKDDLEKEYASEIDEIVELLNQQSSTASDEDDKLQIIISNKINILFDTVTDKYGEKTSHLLDAILF